MNTASKVPAVPSLETAGEQEGVKTITTSRYGVLTHQQAPY